MAKEASSMIVDYAVFVALVLGCALISVWDKIRGNKDQTKADFVFAKSGIAAMLLSFARGTLGVRSFLGYPSELFYNGAAVWETLYGYILAFPVVAVIFVPVYYSLHITSVYQVVPPLNRWITDSHGLSTGSSRVQSDHFGKDHRKPRH